MNEGFSGSALNGLLLLLLAGWCLLLKTRGPFFWKGIGELYLMYRIRMHMRLQLEILALKLRYLWEQFLIERNKTKTSSQHDR
ncbi:hypothetical protein OC25_02020 [Pedobacter kyungheensis]|uniref:Uncharacterized protein n=1 Tax=Pedobacter kyungheensis TaxID=1069985 RepID=A0A0C1DG19_9SPHI|nr:hypothetical protein OC25_02020 [Pedobacter kyungheensis]